MFNDYQYVVAYGLAIVLFMLAIRSRFGYVTVYYSLCLFAFALTLIYSSSLTNLLKPAIDNTNTVTGAVSGETSVTSG
jgi:hypothetical protein